jgi:hypothetical protein
VYLGPDALEALEEGRGVLLGAQRPGWVDAIRFRAAPAGPLKALIERRFRAHGALEPVGIVLGGSELHRLGQAIARELVPGDVVLAVPARRGKPVVYVNRGDRLAPARLKISRMV